MLTETLDVVNQKLASKLKDSKAIWRKLVIACVDNPNGRDAAPDVIVTVLESQGKTTEELKRDIDAYVENQRLVALVADSEAAFEECLRCLWIEDDLRKKWEAAERAREVEDVQAANAVTLARNRGAEADQARNKLLNSLDPASAQQLRQINDTIHGNRRKISDLSQNAYDWRKAIDMIERQPDELARQQAIGEGSDLAQLQAEVQAAVEQIAELNKAQQKYVDQRTKLLKAAICELV